MLAPGAERLASSQVESDHDEPWRVRKTHLVVETLLTHFLEEQLGASEVAAARLSFHIKAALIAESARRRPS